MSSDRIFPAELNAPPIASAVIEDVLTGARALRRAFLETPVRHVSPGATLIAADTPQPTLVLIRQGFVLRSHGLAQGSRAIVDILLPGDIVGPVTLLMARQVGEFTAAAQVVTTAYQRSSFAT